MPKKISSLALGGVALVLTATLALAHGDVAPQPVNTDALPDVGEEWLSENPYREEAAGKEVWEKAIEIGSSGFNQNCARCHGLGAVSGGLAPDLRFLEAEEFGDEWFVERFQLGYTQNGITKMPAFGELLGQKAAWAIRTYIETRPDQDQIDEQTPALLELRDALASMAEGGEGDAAAIHDQLAEIGNGIETLSGAPVADSVASKAAHILEKGGDDAFHKAAETLTIGLSSAH
ncbi:cytochrome c-550 PedF [Donghicola mangrovi]|uniref:Cytochrome c-550 PedF n=1 Tax=Donghicola mangrovi TaxID=2729614 RepID=A0A850Q849_9RHOB|nr:cytochrome c-550 PedF [Donghicola mangrovi]NVO22705.1 cytochrome c-550 PedF [Donghicola mangrovi]